MKFYGFHKGGSPPFGKTHKGQIRAYYSGYPIRVRKEGGVLRKHRWLPLALPVLAAALWPLRRALTAEAIAAWTPRQTGLALAVLSALYLVKGLTALIPITALEAAAGLLFPFPTALAANVCGAAAAQAVPYFLGSRRQECLSALTERCPRLSPLEGVRTGRQVFLLRLAGVLPGELVSLYLGAAGTSRRAYFIGGTLGTFPRVLSATVLGTALWDLGGVRFWASCGFGWALTAAAALVLAREWVRTGTF